MYRNNFRAPQLQNRQNLSFGGGNCGGRRNSVAENCNKNNAAQENCGCLTPVTPCVVPAGCVCEPQGCICEPVTNCGCEPQGCGCETENCVCNKEPEHDCACQKPEPADPGCKPSKKDPISMMPLAMAYVPWQDYKDVYSEEEGWCKGTIFAQLDLDFMARRCN